MVIVPTAKVDRLAPQPLQPSHAFRLTPSHTWSTDTPSNRFMSVARVEAPARARPNRSHGRAGGRIHALPVLRL
jgi:hypothetical protein